MSRALHLFAECLDTGEKITFAVGVDVVVGSERIPLAVTVQDLLLGSINFIRIDLIQMAFQGLVLQAHNRSPSLSKKKPGVSGAPKNMSSLA